MTTKLRKDLLIDTTVLSSNINRRISKNDDRPSSKRIGYVGIIVLCVALCAIVLADLTSLPIPWVNGESNTQSSLMHKRG